MGSVEFVERAFGCAVSSGVDPFDVDVMIREMLVGIATGAQTYQNRGRPKLADVVRRYFGIWPYADPQTGRVVGAAVGVSSSRVYQHLQTAYRLFRHPSRAYRLAPFLTDKHWARIAWPA